MRLIAIIAIVCATLAGASLLFAPLVLDEDRAKASLETILSDLTGRNLVASGPAQLQLWPRPIATLVDVRIGEEREDWSAEVDRLDITIDPMALLIGRMRADSIEVVRPRVLLDDGRLGDWSDGLIALKEWAAEGPADALAVTIVDGLVATVTGGRPTAWQPVSGRVELDPSATSTVHLESERDAGSRVIADLTIEDLGGDRIAPSTLHLRMETEGTSHQLDLLGHADITPLAASFDGDLRFETNDGEAFRRLLDHHSAAGILSSLPLQNLPLNLEGRFRIEGAQVALENLRAGHGPLTISGSVLGRMASPIGIDAGLSFASDEPLPPLVDWLEAFETPPDASGFAGHVRLNANQLPVGTGAMERLSFSAKLAGDEGLEIETFEAILPGETTAAWAGTFSHAEGQTELVGQLEVAGSDLNRFLAWIRPDVAVGQSDEPQRFGASGELRANSEEIALRAARIRLDTSRLDGSVSLAAGVRPELAVRGSINRLNISPWMDTEQNLVDQLADLTRRTQAVDLDLDLDISRLIATDFTAGDLIIDVEATGEQIDIDELSVGRMADTGIELSGRLSRSGDELDLRFGLDSAALNRLTELGQITWPDYLAPPGNAMIGGTLRGPSTAAMLRTEARLGQLTLAYEGAVDLKGFRPVDLGTLELAQPGQFGWLRGFPGAGLLSEKPVAGTLEVVPGDDGSLMVAGPLAVGDSALDLSFSIPSADPIAVALSVDQVDLDELASVFNEVTEAYGGSADRPLDWLGRWPRLAWGDLDLPSRPWHIDVRAAQIRNDDGLSGPAHLTLRLGESDIELVTASIEHDGVVLTLNGRLRPMGEALSVQGSLDVDGRGLPLPIGPDDGAAERTALQLRFRGAGRTAADLVGALDGELIILSVAGEIPGIRWPATTPHTGLPPAADRAVSYQQMTGTLEIENGTLKLDGLSGDFSPRGVGPPVPGRMTGFVDLLVGAMDATVTLGADSGNGDHDGDPPARWRMVGPMDAPQIWIAPLDRTP